MLIGRGGAQHVSVHRRPEPDRAVEHEASTSKIGEDQIFY
jgi:hypothetical protein